MPKHTVYFWKHVPFIRLLLPFIAGIILQWYLQFSLAHVFMAGIAGICVLFIFSFLPTARKYLARSIQGLTLQAMMFLLGAAIAYDKDIRHHDLWIGHHYTDSSAVLVTLQEPLVEKNKSYKALASIDALQVKGKWHRVKGNILVYFKKDSIPPSVKYGSKIIFTKPLQQISNSGNPGAFDYKRFAAFQDIHYQVFLKSTEIIYTGTNSINYLKQWMFDTRFAVIRTLKKYIYNESEAAVAEALLIGYRDDLDKDLVQAYSNTGVVHIIAISGLHLGLIYGAMVWLFRLFKKRRFIIWIKPLVLLVVLWTFTLLAGAAPSILRSAVMFSFIILGEAISRKTSIYNTLAASAFAMLCYNPFFLWDVGFQLSYAAVISIITFMKPVYNWFYIKNKMLNAIWKLNAVTLSAQLLTFPIVLYHFHQFPNLFILTNFVAVPLSSVILFTELTLLLTAFLPAVASIVGAVNSSLLNFMNRFVEQINEMPISVTNNIQISATGTIVLFLAVIAFSIWLLMKQKTAFHLGLCMMVVFITIQSIDIQKHKDQHKVIVYNVPQHSAIDFIEGNMYKFIGDSTVLNDNFIQNFHLKPSRTIHRIQPASTLPALQTAYPFLLFKQDRIVLIDQPLRFASVNKMPVDVIIISKNPRLFIKDLAAVFDCKQYVFDASNPLWKIKLWKKDCDSLNLPHYSIPDKGAFEMEL